MLIDTHAHLDYAEFEQDFEQVLERAQAAGVTRIITIGTSVGSSQRAVRLAEKYPAVFAVVGVHPTSVDGAEADVITPLRELAKNPRVVAIGETGMDYHHLPGGELDRACKSAQAVLFQAQLDLAAGLGLNVVIHQRDAWNDTLEILRPYTGRLRGVFHCFGNSFEQASEVIGLNHMVSFTGIVTFKNAPVAQDVARRVAPEAYMVETDCPYLAPVPFRGKRCEPAHTRLVAEAVAKLRGETIGQVAERTTENAGKFFRFPS
jgi:TatD DNase family protein